MALDQRADHHGGQLVDERPGLRFAQQALEQSRVRRLEAITAELQEPDRDPATLVDGPRPERIHEERSSSLSRRERRFATPRARARTAGTLTP
jgi:hypothetical protein